MSFTGFEAVNGYAGGSLDFETSNNFFHQITEHSSQKMAELSKKPNPALDALSPETFQVSAKINSKIWDTQQYRDEHHRQLLMQTTNRDTQSNFDVEVMERLRQSKYNIQRTIITEYSDAMNRGTVFVNAKFSSC